MKKVLLLLGPTASGKSAAAMTVLRGLPCEIVSVDSCQVYRGLDIGSAKPNGAEQRLVPHHLIDVCDPCEVFTVNDFIVQAEKAIHKIHAKGSLPVMVGGTAMYAYRFLNGISPIPQIDQKTRLVVSEISQNKGAAYMWQELVDVLPAHREILHPNDAQRIMRAYEVWLQTGRPIYSYWEQNEKPKFDFDNIVMMPETRQSLLPAVKERLGKMMDEGFIDEVVSLRARGDLSLSLPSMRSVGYRQVWQYLDGELSKDDLEESIVRATMRYVKHQCTWLNKWAVADHVRPNHAVDVLRKKLALILGG